MEIKEKKYIILLIDTIFKKYCEELVGSLKECKIISIPDKEKAREFFLHNNVDMVLLEHSDSCSCTEILKYFKLIKPSIPVVVITDCGSEALAVNVFRCGARNYISSPFDLNETKKFIKETLGLGENTFSRVSDVGMIGLHRAIRYIDENYCSKITLSQIAKEAGMSVSCFERTFKKKMGITLTEYVNKRRISKAIKMLKEKDFSIGEIAFNCGFTNQSHFTRTFRKITKTSPTAFRKSLKG